LSAGRPRFARSRGAGRLLAAGLGLALAFLVMTGADDPAGTSGGMDLDALGKPLRHAAAAVVAWYERTPASDRMAWGGLGASAALGLGVLAERSLRLRRRRIVPDDFTARFLDRLEDGRLDRGKALDFCELNPSPASRVALAAVKRWGRPVVDLERAVSLAHRVEAETLRRHVGSLRRIAALAPLIGLLGTLVALSRTLAGLETAGTAGSWGPALAAALGPLTAGVALATLALVAFDGLTGKVESLSGTLDRIGASTIDAIALATPAEPRGVAGMVLSHGPSPTAGPHTLAHPPTTAAPSRTPHQVRLEVPQPKPQVAPRMPMPIDPEDDFD
jgi:biopolymer transport protein ExbB